MTDFFKSISGCSIRLTDERWSHITEEHSELAGFRLEVFETVSRPDRLVSGNSGEILAIKEIDLGKVLVVVYREIGDDGFIITAFQTRRLASIKRRKQLWP